MEHVIKGKGKEIGFGAITEIKLYEVKGALKLVGPLPADVQNYTSYSAALMSNSPSPDAAKAFMTFLGTPAAKQAFVIGGDRVAKRLRRQPLHAARRPSARPCRAAEPGVRR